MRSWWREWRETLMWGALALLMVAYFWERQRMDYYAVSALARDGYTEIQLIGRDCRVARAFDKEGDRVEAYACAWGPDGGSK